MRFVILVYEFGFRLKFICFDTPDTINSGSALSETTPSHAVSSLPVELLLFYLIFDF